MRWGLYLQSLANDPIKIKKIIDLYKLFLIFKAMIKYKYRRISGYDCYQVMSELEQRRWQREVIKRVDVPSNALLGMKYHNFCDFIGSSFNWDYTKQGTEYWASICEKYKLHDQLNPGPYFKTKPPKTF